MHSNWKNLDVFRIANAQYVEYVRSTQQCTFTAVCRGASAGLLARPDAERVGAFASDTYLQLVDTLLTSKHAHTSVLSSFLSKFSQYADCRFHLLRWITSTSAAQARTDHMVEVRGPHAALKHCKHLCCGVMVLTHGL